MSNERRNRDEKNKFLFSAEICKKKCAASNSSNLKQIQKVLAISHTTLNYAMKSIEIY